MVVTPPTATRTATVLRTDGTNSISIEGDAVH
jgi:hypothetical protein